MISVVVPFYNEEENIEPLHTELNNILKSLNREYSIFFVDDGSTDNTYKNMVKVSEKDDRIKIIKFRKKFRPTGIPREDVYKYLEKKYGYRWKAFNLSTTTQPKISRTTTEVEKDAERNDSI